MLREPHLIKGKVESLRVTHGYDNFVLSPRSIGGVSAVIVERLFKC